MMCEGLEADPRAIIGFSEFVFVAQSCFTKLPPKMRQYKTQLMKHTEKDQSYGLKLFERLKMAKRVTQMEISLLSFHNVTRNK